jgi:hypothetical protein
MPGVHSPMQRIELVAGMALLAAGFGPKQRDRAVSSNVESHVQGPKRHFFGLACRKFGDVPAERRGIWTGGGPRSKSTGQWNGMAVWVAPEWYRDFARRLTICTCLVAPTKMGHVSARHARACRIAQIPAFASATLPIQTRHSAKDIAPIVMAHCCRV